MGRQCHGLLQALLIGGFGHTLQNSLERSQVPFKSKGLPAFCVNGTWNVPTTLTFVGCVGLK